MSAEDWRPVPDWPGYEVDLNNGAVRSLDRVITERPTGRRRRLKGRDLVIVDDVRGHPQVTLSRPGRRKVYRIERLRSLAADPGAATGHTPPGGPSDPAGSPGLRYSRRSS